MCGGSARTLLAEKEADHCPLSTEAAVTLVETIRFKILHAQTDRFAGQWPATRIVILTSAPEGRHRKKQVVLGRELSDR